MEDPIFIKEKIPGAFVSIPDASVSLREVVSYVTKKTEDTVTEFADSFAVSGASLSRGANVKDIFTNPAGSFVLTLALVGVGIITFIRAITAIRKVREAKFKQLQALLVIDSEKNDSEPKLSAAQIQQIITNIKILRVKLKPAKPKKLDVRKKYYDDLNQGKIVAQDRSKLNVSTVGTSLRWFIPVFCVFGMILFSVDGGFTLQLLTQFFSSPMGIGVTVGAVTVGASAGLIRRFFNSRSKALIRKRKLSAPKEYEANLIEFDKLYEIVPEDKQIFVRQAWDRIIQHKFYTIENKRTRSPAQVDMQKEFLIALRLYLDTGHDVENYNNFHTHFISNLDETLPATLDNNTQLSEEEKADLSTDMNTLSTLDRNSVLRSAFGFSLMWFLIALSLPGIDFTDIPTMVALFTTPPGWVILGCCIAVGIIGFIPKYFSKKRLKLKERRERVQHYLLEYEERRKTRPELYDLWKDINTIDDIALRARVQHKALASANLEEDAKVITALCKEYRLSNKIIKPAMFNQNNKYVLYHEGKLTRADKWSVLRSGIGSYFNASIPVFCMAGLVLINLTVGFVGFLSLLALVTTPVGWGLLAIAITVGLIFAIRKIYVKTQEKIKEREDRALEEMEFNELEFKRLGSQRQDIWDHITNTKDFSKPAIVELQKDFLASLLYDQRHVHGGSETTKFYTGFKALEIEIRAKEKNKDRIIPTFADNQDKYDAINNKKLTTREMGEVTKSALGAVLTGLLPGVGIGALIVTIGITAGVLSIMGPIGLAIIGVGLLIGVGYAVYRFNEQRELKIAERQNKTNSETAIATYDSEFNKLISQKKPGSNIELVLTTEQAKAISDKWEAINTLEYNDDAQPKIKLKYNDAAQAEIKKDFLEGLKCVVIYPDKFYEKFITTALVKKEQKQSLAYRVTFALKTARAATPKPGYAPLPSEPTSHTLPEMSLLQRFSLRLTNNGKSGENNLPTQNPNPTPGQQPSQK